MTRTDDTLTRRMLLRRGIGATAAGAAGCVAVDARYHAPFHPVLERVTIAIPTLPPAFDGLRIVHLSDLHVQPAFPVECLGPALDLARAAQPDLVVLTGDYRYDHAFHGDREIMDCATALRGFDRIAPLGVFAVYGNHDYPQPPAQPDEGIWEAVGVTTLRNRSVEVRRGQDRLFLIGLDSMISRPASPFGVISALPHGACAIVLWHEPDRALETALAGAALQLSGHTHGGQVVLPFVGPPVLPVFGKLYPAGLYRVRGMPLYVSRGVGLLPPLVRFNCPPEVTLLTLRRTEGG